MEIYDEFNALDEGIEPGGLRNKDEIKVLVCYLLKTLDTSITREQIGNIMQDQGIANYFETMDAISELLSNGSVSSNFIDEKECLEVTDIGKNAVVEVGNDLPKTVREKALKSALRFITLERNERENEVKIEPCEGGYEISFALKDKDTALMKLAMFVGDREQAEKLKNNFLEDPARVYGSILASLMID
ncbi:MAG: DUF4364 family protein [Clostridia bacterium]|nr:DUF4364 family protein [Clostridia bacterium]